MMKFLCNQKDNNKFKIAAIDKTVELYVLDLVNSVNIASSTINYYDYHVKCSHPSVDILYQKAKIENLRIINRGSFNCEICLRSKMASRINKISDNPPTEILHSDVCGPFYNEKSIDNAKYFLLVIDRFSRKSFSAYQ